VLYADQVAHGCHCAFGGGTSGHTRIFWRLRNDFHRRVGFEKENVAEVIDAEVDTSILEPEPVANLAENAAKFALGRAFFPPKETRSLAETIARDG
jgi:hypothetical protein